MAIPSGGGSEVLKRTTIHAQSNTDTAFRWDGTMATTGTATYTVPTNHIISVLSVTMAESGNAAKLISMYIHDGGNFINILNNQSIGAYGTFVFSDRFVLTAGDKLIVNCGSAANVDFICSYIDQDWT